MKKENIAGIKNAFADGIRKNGEEKGTKVN